MRPTFLLSAALLSAALLVACTTGSSTGSAPKALEIPADLRADVERAKKLGRLIWENDLVSWRATDVLFEAKVLPDPASGFRGWVTFPGDDGAYRVDFVTELPDGSLAATHEVLFEKGTAVEEDMDRFDPPRALKPDVAAMFRARVTALKQLKDLCGDGPNPVVLPASLVGKEGWLVYILASSKDASERVVAGHRLFRVSADGATVLEEMPLSRTCMITTAQPGPGGAMPVALYVNHIVSPAPMETHVYTSLFYKMELIVGTARGIWRISGGDVTFLRNREAVSE